MSKFTKGPWHTNGAFIGGPLSSEGDDIVSSLRYRGDEETNANAHLIAAAPEMYEALNNIINDCSGFMDEYLEPAIEALAKARGES